MRERAALAVEAGAHDESLVVCDARLGQAAPVALLAPVRHVQRRRAGQERDPPVAQLDQRRDHPLDAGRVVDADVGLAEGVRREVHDRRAVGPHRRHVLGHLVVEAGSSRPLPAKMIVAARIERSRRTYDCSRSAIRSELQVMTRKPPTDAASSTPRTTSAKYGSVMSWTITPTTGM